MLEQSSRSRPGCLRAVPDISLPLEQAPRSLRCGVENPRRTDAESFEMLTPGVTWGHARNPFQAERRAPQIFSTSRDRVRAAVQSESKSLLRHAPGRGPVPELPAAPTDG